MKKKNKVTSQKKSSNLFVLGRVGIGNCDLKKHFNCWQLAMEDQNNKKEILLPHHEQQELCTTRLPYRQGRKLTAVKVYSIINESNHLLIFGVPSLNLRQEAKALFAKFGKLTQFNISKEHAAEVFTETYHAVFETIQSARLAKRMLDTKNFYGGSLHVCYAPEFEDVAETRKKLLQRQKDVLVRLRNLQRHATVKTTKDVEIPVPINSEVKKLNMGDVNTIDLGYKTLKRRNNRQEYSAKEKLYKPCFVINTDNEIPNSRSNTTTRTSKNSDFRLKDNSIEMIDCTSANLDTVTNINESLSDDCLSNLQTEQINDSSVNNHLNYNNFGNEVIKKVPVKGVNKIKFCVNKT